MTTMQERLIAGYEAVIADERSTPEVRMEALRSLSQLTGSPGLVDPKGAPVNAPPPPSASRSAPADEIVASDSPVQPQPPTARERAAVRMGRGRSSL